MVILVIAADALEYLDAVGNGRLVYGNRLEPALERGVLFDMLAVLGEGSCTDDLYLASRERRLEDVRSVHAALGVACADDVMHLVDNEDYIALLADLLDKSLHAAFKLASELRSGDQRRQVKKIDLLTAKLIWNLIERYALSKPLGNGSLADARLADKAGIVLLAAVEDLDNALKLLLAAYHIIELSGSGSVGKIYAVIVQELALRRLSALLGRLLRGCIVALGRRVIAVSEQSVEKRECCGLAVIIGIVVCIIIGVDAHIHKAFDSVESVHHLAAEIVKILIGYAHFFDHIVNGLYMKLPCAFKAQSLVFLNSALKLRNKHHRDVFAAA